MYYLRIDDLNATLLCTDGGRPVVVQRNIIPGAFPDTLAEISSAIDAQRLDVLVSGPTTIVPSSELEDTTPETQDIIFNSCFNFVDNTPRRVFYDDIPALHAHLLFAVKDNICNAIIEQFPTTELRFVSSLTPLVRHFSESYDGTSRFRVYLNCRDRFVDVFAFDGRQLAVFNSFPVSSISDVVYYALAFAKTIGFSPASTPYYAVGDNGKAADVVAHLRQFAHKATVLDITEELGKRPLTQNPDIPHDLVFHILCAS